MKDLNLSPDPAKNSGALGTDDAREWKNKNKKQFQNEEYASPGLRQNSKRNRKRNSYLPTRQRNYTILAGQKVNGNSIHKSRKRLDFAARRNRSCTRVKIVQKATKRR